MLLVPPRADEKGPLAVLKRPAPARLRCRRPSRSCRRSPPGSADLAGSVQYAVGRVSWRCRWCSRSRRGSSIGGSWRSCVAAEHGRVISARAVSGATEGSGGAVEMLWAPPMIEPPGEACSSPMIRLWEPVLAPGVLVVADDQVALAVERRGGAGAVDDLHVDAREADRGLAVRTSLATCS